MGDDVDVTQNLSPVKDMPPLFNPRDCERLENPQISSVLFVQIPAVCLVDFPGRNIYRYKRDNAVWSAVSKVKR